MASVFENIPLRRNGGSDEDSSALKNKIVGIYCSAHWCGPCLLFTPKLKEFYEAVGTNEFEIVFVSSDQSEKEMDNYLKEEHGNWLYIPFGDENIDLISDKYQVVGIPTLVILKPDGTLLKEDGRSDVEEKSPSEVLSAWKS